MLTRAWAEARLGRFLGGWSRESKSLEGLVLVDGERMGLERDPGLAELCVDLVVLEEEVLDQ